MKLHYHNSMFYHMIRGAFSKIYTLIFSSNLGEIACTAQKAKYKSFFNVFVQSEKYKMNL